MKKQCGWWLKQALKTIAILLTLGLSIVSFRAIFMVGKPQTEETTLPCEATVVKVRMSETNWSSASILVEESDAALLVPRLDSAKLEEIRSLQYGQTIAFRAEAENIESFEREINFYMTSLETNGHVIYTLEDFNAAQKGVYRFARIGFSVLSLLFLSIAIWCFLSFWKETRKKFPRKEEE